MGTVWLLTNVPQYGEVINAHIITFTTIVSKITNLVYLVIEASELHYGIQNHWRYLKSNYPA